MGWISLFIRCSQSSLIVKKHIEYGIFSIRVLEWAFEAHECNRITYNVKMCVAQKNSSHLLFFYVRMSVFEEATNTKAENHNYEQKVLSSKAIEFQIFPYAS